MYNCTSNLYICAVTVILVDTYLFTLLLNKVFSVRKDFVKCYFAIAFNAVGDIEVSDLT